MNVAAFDVCVNGGGAVARSLALALSGEGWRVAWACEPEPSPHHGAKSDVRTYALNAKSIALLERLRVWPQLQRYATPVHDMQVRGDDGGALAFSAWQQCVSELTWIVDAAQLERLLGEALRYAPHVTRVPPANLSDSLEMAPLLAVCEGKFSGTREALGVSFARQAYGQWGVAARLQASVPHAGRARQWFRSPDVLALLPFNDPLPQASYGLVWSVPEARAQALLALAPAAFEAELAAALQRSDPQAAHDVGSLTLASSVMAWPLAQALADTWVGPGWALLGDAAHQVHPLAGQGLNLGLADVEALLLVLREAREREPWRSPGDEKLLRRYARARWLPTQAMSQLTDALVRGFAHEHGLARDLRNRGMVLLNQLTPVKRWLVSRALDA